MKGSGRAGPLAGPTFTRGTVPEYTTQDKAGKLVWEPGLPAEVTSRRTHRPVRGKEPTEEAPVQCDLRSTLKLAPSARADWLEKSLKAIPHGRAKVQEVFNVVTHPKFVSGVPTRIGRRMLHEVAKSLGEFSDKQRVTLVAKCKLAELFQATSSGDGEEEDGDEVPEAGDFAVGGGDEETTNRGERHHHRAGSRSHSRERRRRRRAPSTSPPPPPPGNDRHHPGRPPPPTATLSDEFGIAGHNDTHGLAGGSDQQLLSPEEAASYEEAVMERERQQEEEKRKLENERLIFEERERKRKANLGAAFLVGDEDDDDETVRPAPFGSGRVRPSEIAFADPTPSMPLLGASGPIRGGGSMSSDSSMDPRFVESMGGDKLLAEAHKILASASRTGRLGAPDRGRSRSRRRRSRSRSRRGPNMRSSGSYRSPTPDGPARGMARAARKAKMIASLMGMK